MTGHRRVPGQARTPRAGLAAIALLLLVAPAAAQSEAYYEVNDIEYYYAAGVFGSGHMSLGFDPEATMREDVEMCAWAKLRPDNNKGRVQAKGLWKDIPLIVDMSDFPSPGVGQDSVAPGGEGAIGPGVAHTVPSTIHAAGNATVRLGNLAIVDPVTGEPVFDGAWFVTRDGYRDDATGRVLGGGHPGFQPGGELRTERGAMEMHFQLTSKPGPKQSDASWSWQEPSDGTPYLLPDQDHQRLHLVPNLRLTGTAVVQVSAQSAAPPGSNHLVVQVHAPNGTRVGTFSLQPSVLADASDRIEFPLRQFGAYAVTVSGNVNMASYDLVVTQRTPDAFHMDLWWDVVEPGYDGLQAKYACDEALQGQRMGGFVAPRAPPEQFAWVFSGYTVAATFTTIVVAASIVVSARANAAAKRSVQQ